mmetsp:Transcript_64421/g.153684  ORF Transcript_64421/g.153684 Transcript_64421/m.153684 type:complete len:103 (+) Transcript_64421:102-410(+)
MSLKVWCHQWEGCARRSFDLPQNLRLPNCDTFKVEQTFDAKPLLTIRSAVVEHHRDLAVTDLHTSCSSSIHSLICTTPLSGKISTGARQRRPHRERDCPTTS